MTVDLNIAGVISGVFLLLLGLIAYFAKGVMNRLEGIEAKSTQTALQVAQQEKEVENIADEVNRMRDKMNHYDSNTELFFKEFNNNVQNAVRPFFDALNIEMKNIHKDIERVEKAK